MFSENLLINSCQYTKTQINLHYYGEYIILKLLKSTAKETFEKCEKLDTTLAYFWVFLYW